MTVQTNHPPARAGHHLAQASARGRPEQPGRDRDPVGLLQDEGRRGRDPQDDGREFEQEGGHARGRAREDREGVEGDSRKVSPDSSIDLVFTVL